MANPTRLYDCRCSLDIVSSTSEFGSRWHYRFRLAALWVQIVNQAPQVRQIAGDAGTTASDTLGCESSCSHRLKYASLHKADGKFSSSALNCGCSWHQCLQTRYIVGQAGKYGSIVSMSGSSVSSTLGCRSVRHHHLQYVRCVVQPAGRSISNALHCECRRKRRPL